MDMLVEKKRAEIHRQLKAVTQDPKLQEALKEWVHAYEHEQKARATLQKIENKLGVSYSTHSKKFDVQYRNDLLTFADEKVVQRLNRASMLAYLGNYKEAKKIWDAIISEHRLTEA